jgi:hypothetical protein
MESVSEVYYLKQRHLFQRHNLACKTHAESKDVGKSEGLFWQQSLYEIGFEIHFRKDFEDSLKLQPVLNELIHKGEDFVFDSGSKLFLSRVLSHKNGLHLIKPHRGSKVF